MSSLESLVRSTVLDFVTSLSLFTALDVSNKVKESMPQARHRQVRDIVRQLFITDMEPAGYTKTPISVTLEDGSNVDALLYHHVSDSFDLEIKYDAQKRSQTSYKITTDPSPAPTDVVSDTLPQPDTKDSADPTATDTLYDKVSDKRFGVRQLWEMMFKLRPSLFSRK